MKGKTSKTFIILMITVIAVAVLAYWNLPFVLCTPPLGKNVKVGIFCDETKEPVPDGFAVTLTQNFGGGHSWKETTVTGLVQFGDMIAGDYIIDFYWNKDFRYEVTIDCSKECWRFNYYVQNPKIVKHFVNVCGCDTERPIVGLPVTLYEDGSASVTGTSDDTGTVVFDGKYVDVCKEYVLVFTVAGHEYIEPQPAIHFEYDKYGRLPVCVWEETNYFTVPKNGGCTLAEPVR